MPILMSVSSGHGNGKAVLGAWIANWIMSTRPHSIGTVTANTFRQLESRTWAAFGEPMFFASGQPSRSNGKFHEITFGSQRNRWNHRTIDSRTSRFTNRELIEHWRVDNGEDSDFFRVRVLGVPPRASDL